ncbi:MAG: serine hydrolase [Ignavibacteria bacterium]|nr:serine hydrolase [Ignavibacteria bacterium]
MKYIKFIFILFIFLTGSSAEFKPDDFNPKYSEDIENRIDSIINNLRVKTNKEGVFQSSTLSDRMKFYHTPGVSIAVINDGKVEWARGFGIRNDRTNDSVNVNTFSWRVQ